jgi:Flp pilus assembly protein TadD
MRRPVLLAAALVLLTALVHGGALRAQFVDWDDDVNVSKNPRLDPPTLSSVFRFWTAPYLRLYIPLTYTAWAAIAPLAQGGAGKDGAEGLDPRPFHAANLVVHAAGVVAVFAILRRVVGQDLPAACGALLFSIHPVQVEPVAWVTGMKDVLGGALALAAIWVYVEHAARAREAGGMAGGRAAAGGRLRLATALFALALLAKPSAAAAPLVAWCLDRWAVGRGAREATRDLAAWFALAVGWGALTLLVQPRETVDFAPSLPGRILVAADALAFSIRHVLWPAALGIDYGRTPAAVVERGVRLDVLAPLVALGLAVVWARRRAPWALAAAGVFAASLLPTLGLVPFAFQNQSTVADRYLYVAMLGPALAAAFALRRAPAADPAAGAGPRPGAAVARFAGTPRAALVVAFALVAAILAARSVAQVRVWRDSETLFAHALAVNPRSPVAHNLRGLALVRAGRAAEAESAFAEAVRLRPGYVDAHNNLGVALVRQGRRDEAAACFEHALALQPGDPEAETNLGNLALRGGDAAQARRRYEAALVSRPDHLEALSNLGVALARQGEPARAIAHYERAIRTRPRSPELHGNLGILLLSEGRTAEAIAQLEEAARLGSRDPEVRAQLARARGQAGTAP